MTEKMPVEAGTNAAEIKVAAGDVLVLRIAAYDPAGISKIVVQCYQFSIGSSNKTKLAVGEVEADPESCRSNTVFDVGVPIPQNAALGKWGVQVIEFTNGRGYKYSFYRGQEKFDDIMFDVVAPPSKEDKPLLLNRVEIAGSRRL